MNYCAIIIFYKFVVSKCLCNFAFGKLIIGILYTMERKIKPGFIFEISWEVCNKIGGIYAVLLTKSRSMVKFSNGNLLFVGPDLKQDVDNKLFISSDESNFLAYLQNTYGLTARIGKWNIPGNPKAILVDFSPLYDRKNEIYTEMWQDFGVDSLHAYGDYDEASMFGVASGMVVKAYCEFYRLHKKRVVAHFNEWMTGFGLFYLKKYYPHAATLFTTHATTVGRSIAGNGKEFYKYFSGFHGFQMAEELNVVSKHSVEYHAAHLADCFTTVSNITNNECVQLLDKSADVITPNGFDIDIVPRGAVFNSVTASSRKKLIAVAEQLLGEEINPESVITAISGRYEFKNKGIDVYIDALSKINNTSNIPVLAYILVPAWHSGAKNLKYNQGDRITTHNLMQPDNDPVLCALKSKGLVNSKENNVKVIFVPAYLCGDDGVFDLSYYRLLSGFDMTLFPSYYEPWGYTPLESVFFGIPTVTTSLSGFGNWVNPDCQDIDKGVAVINRDDTNFDYVSSKCAEQIIAVKSYIADGTISSVKNAAKEIAKDARWFNFFEYYKLAYSFALKKKKNNF